MRVDRLREYMDKRGQNPESLEELVSVSERQIWRWLKGEFTPNVDALGRVAQALEVSADYLLGLSDDPTPALKVDNLTADERDVLSAMRRGEKLEAIRIIASDH